MIHRLNTQLLLQPNDFSPTRPDFHIIGVFNPGAARVGDDIILLVRVAQACDRQEPGFLFSPRSRCLDGQVQYEVDRLPISANDNGDHRKPLVEGGFRRLAFISHLELIRLSPDGMQVREIKRLNELFGQNENEEYGVEDPRITRIGDTWYITCVTVSSYLGVCTSLMSTTDFKTFTRHGSIFSCENKDVVLFPERINGVYHAYHRPVGHINIRKTAILAAESPDLIHWGRHRYILGCATSPDSWYASRIGAGPPPVKTEKGWLSIFHGVRHRSPDDPVGEYTAGAMLTALDEPWRLIGLADQPFFRAETEFERAGYVKEVVFPTGIVRDLNDPDRLLIFYGCADSCVAVAAFSQTDILQTLRPV